MLRPRPIVIFEGELFVPSNVGSLEAFRHWSMSKDFPESVDSDGFQLSAVLAFYSLKEETRHRIPADPSFADPLAIVLRDSDPSGYKVIKAKWL